MMSLVADSPDYLMLWVLVVSVMVLFLGYWVWGYVKSKCLLKPDEFEVYACVTREANVPRHLIQDIDFEHREDYVLDTYPLLLRVKRNGREYNLRQRDLFTTQTDQGLQCIAVGQLINYDGSEECVTLSYLLSDDGVFTITDFPLDHSITDFILSYKVAKYVPSVCRTELQCRCRGVINSGIGGD